ncbi:protoporphyrinogen oxidase [Candidatus Scalindua japonica]|uniref:Protoporphyrinogen oxidase n=1 Tax=Candidatus Scalindua japonica TaxID=1284222 RepID=A0A286TX20_9BACT|nr:FAD-dependent oxidoreductase [Candidatus Scalindua japonica]GAX60428.1 protoporphyrinogen oxidase [Candidatus Scalindua japonica]
MKKYLIIGAGLSGLRIGQLLALDGNKVDIFEMEDEVGGLMKTREKEGFLFDIGPHIFFKDYAEEYKKLISNDLHNIRVLYGVGFSNKDIISPIRPVNLLKNLGIRKSLPLVADVMLHKMSKSNENAETLNNAEDWVISNFGKKVYECFFKDYIPKVMGLQASKVTEDWGTERHKFYKEHNLSQKSSKFLLNFIFNKENKGGYLDVYYPENGAQQVPVAICEEIKKLGGKIHLKTKVDRIEIADSKVTGIVIQKEGGIEEKINTGNDTVVINTMPITNLFSSIMTPDANSDAIKGISSNLKYRNLWLFNFILKRDKLKNKAQIYFPEKKYIFKRVYEPNNLLNDPVRNGKTAICVEVCYNEGDEVESMGEEALYSRVMEGLKDFYSISDEDVLDMWSMRVPYSYSIYNLGYKEVLLKMVEYLFEIDSLISFGRQGSFKYNHMTNRVMDSCNSLQKFLKSGSAKKNFLTSPDCKSDFF